LFVDELKFAHNLLTKLSRLVYLFWNRNLSDFYHKKIVAAIIKLAYCGKAASISEKTNVKCEKITSTFHASILTFDISSLFTKNIVCHKIS